MLSRFRVEFYECLYARPGALFELTDAVLWKDGPVKTLVELSLRAEHRRGHGALYQALDAGWIEPARLRMQGLLVSSGLSKPETQEASCPNLACRARGVQLGSAVV